MANTVTVYDPQREMVVDVPADQSKLLVDAGYKIGPEAELEEKVQGLPGKVAAGMMGIANGATFGLAQRLVPKSLLHVQNQVEQAHPLVHGAGEMLGGAGSVAAAGAAGAATGAGAIFGRLAAGAAAGAGEETARAIKNNEPIAAERVLQGAGLGLFFAGLGEGADMAIRGMVPAARKVLDKAAKVWPKEGTDAPWLDAVRSDATKYADEMGDRYSAKMMRDYAKEAPEKAKYKRALDLETLWAASHVLPKPMVAAVAGADRATAFALNRLDAIHGGLDHLQTGPIQAMGATVRTLVSAKPKSLEPPVAHGDIDRQYAEASTQVQRAASNPEGVQAYINKTYGRAFQEHPDLMAQVSARVQMAATVLNEQLPKSPYDPALINKPVDPPRSAKLAWLQVYHAANNPLEALKNPTPRQVQVMDEIHPETVNLVRQSVAAWASTQQGNRMTPTQARRISVILKGPVRPQNSPDYYKRLEMTNTTPPGPPIDSPQSTSAATSGTTRDATNPMKLMLGE